MGCSASKGSTRKRPARESWYAPVSRSTSAPIHYTADFDADSCYSPSTPYSFTQDTTPFGQCDRSSSNKSSLASMLKEEELEYAEAKGNHVAENDSRDFYVYRPTARDNLGHESEPRKRVAVSKAHAKFSSSLIPVAEVCECENGDVGIINTWEILNRLDDDYSDDGRRKSPSLVRTETKHSVFEKSQSFNKVHGLDSCFTELNTPVWQSYVSEQEKEAGNEVKRKTSNEEVGLRMEQSESNSTSPAKSPFKSPLRTPLKPSVQSSLRSPLKSPLGSPLRSPLKSPLMGSSSPLFDPSLLAKFEQAVDATALPHDDWFTRSNIEESITTSSSSFYNHTWGLSETSSDGESPHSTLTENGVAESGTLPSWNKNMNALCELDSFEIRCPPKGEDKVVLYFTSLRGVRKTYEDCCVLRRILQGLGVHVDERDVWMHSKFREELTDLFDNKRLQVPQLFIKGRYIGGVEEVSQLHEDGALAGLIEGMPFFGMHRKACEGCADMRFVPCITCHGSCKRLDNRDQVIRCSECNENGLILCPLCS